MITTITASLRGDVGGLGHGEIRTKINKVSTFENMLNFKLPYSKGDKLLRVKFSPDEVVHYKRTRPMTMG